MRNLFIAHTQYNLILAFAVARQEKRENNDLVIFHDFKVTDELLERLQRVFGRVTVLEGNVPKRTMSAPERLSYLRQCCRTLKQWMRGRCYDRIFVVDDMCIPEMYAMKQGYRANAKVQLAWLEDGAIAYFSNGVMSGGMGGTPCKRLIRKLFFGIAFGLGGFYDLSDCMGGHKKLSHLYVTFPEQLRDELKSKITVEIDDEAFCHGMKLMYGETLFPFEENSVLLAMDKLDVYGEALPVIEGVVADLVKTARAQGKHVYYKYHPRETSSLSALAEEEELDRSVGLERYLTSCSHRAVTVVGIKSTALQTAQKMGYPTVSMITATGDAPDEIVSFYRAIGITCADDTSALHKSIKIQKGK